MAPVVPLLQLRGLPPALDTGVSWGAPPTPVQQRTMIWRSCRAQFKTRTFLNAARDLRAASESGSARVVACPRLLVAIAEPVPNEPALITAPMAPARPVADQLNDWRLKPLPRPLPPIEARALLLPVATHRENATPLGGLVTSGSLGTCSDRGRRVMKSTASEPTTEPPRMAYQHSRHESSGCKRRPRGPPGNAGCEFCQTGSRERRLFQSG